MSGGTLLGAVRDGDFIPWDWDVEVTVLTERAKPEIATITSLLDRHGLLVVRVNNTTRNLKIVAIFGGTEYEILGRYLRRRQFRSRKMTQVSSKFFETPATIVLRGHEFPAPNPPEEFLTNLYGDWRTPKRTSNHNEYLSSEAYLTPKSLKNRLIKVLKSLLTSS